MAENNKPVRITNTVPAISSDGHGIGVNPDTGDANLLFIQVAPNQDPEKVKELEASVVANVRMNLVQLKQLNEAITKAVANFKPKE